MEGLYLPGFSADDAAPDIGDSVITETAGIGGFAMAAAPAIVKFVGGEPEDAIEFTNAMYDITCAENTAYQIPALDFRGTPTGIDIMKVVETGILPAINTGIAHKEPGIGMVGAGLVKPPSEVFAEAASCFPPERWRWSINLGSNRPFGPSVTSSITRAGRPGSSPSRRTIPSSVDSVAPAA